MLTLKRLSDFTQGLQLRLLDLSLGIQGQLGVRDPAACTFVLLQEWGRQRRLLLVWWVMHQARVHRALWCWLRRRIALPCAL